MESKLSTGADTHRPVWTNAERISWGNRYFITFIDDYSRMCWVYFFRNKSDTLNVFKKFKALVELQNGYKLKLRSDRSGEYTSNEFQEFYVKQGMERQLTIAYSP